MNRISFLWLGLFVLVMPSLTPAGDKDKAVARLRSPLGTVLVRGEKTWATPALFDSISSGVEILALPGARGILEVKEGDLRLTLAGNLPELSLSPSQESVVKLQASAGHDLELSLQRGRVLIENLAESGSTKVRIHVDREQFDVELLEKNVVVALELFRRWPAGTPFREKPEADVHPVGDLYFLVLKGKVVLDLKGEKQTLQAPVLYRWTTLRGVEGPTPLKKLPEWVHPGMDKSEKAKALHQAVEKLRLAIAKAGAAKAIAEAHESDDVKLRQVAAHSALALDELSLGVKALEDKKSGDVRTSAVTGLMHYIGRGSAEPLRLFKALQASDLKLRPATIVMELLHGVGPKAVDRPETYETLIDYLQNDHAAIRELAAWHLYKLVPQGRKIAYDSAGPPEQRARADTEWRKLIPPGQLPPKEQK